MRSWELQYDLSNRGYDHLSRVWSWKRLKTSTSIWQLPSSIIFVRSTRLVSWSRGPLFFSKTVTFLRLACRDLRNSRWVERTTFSSSFVSESADRIQSLQPRRSVARIFWFLRTKNHQSRMKVLICKNYAQCSHSIRKKKICVFAGLKGSKCMGVLSLTSLDSRGATKHSSSHFTHLQRQYRKCLETCRKSVRLCEVLDFHHTLHSATHR